MQNKAWTEPLSQMSLCYKVSNIYICVHVGEKLPYYTSSALLNITNLGVPSDLQAPKGVRAADVKGMMSM